MLSNIKDKTKKSHVRSINFFYFSLFTCFFFLESFGQCAMCRASLQNEANATVAKGVNDGIVYLMVIPYILVGLVFFAIYKMFKNKRAR